MKPFVLLASRSEDVAADDEYASLLRLSGLPSAELHRVRMEAGEFTPLALADYAGVILGGSPFTASTPEEHKSDDQRRIEAELDGLVADVLRQQVPFLGLCYGVGVVGRSAGGVVDSTYSEETGPARIVLTDDGAREPLLAGLPRTFDAYVGHKEACTVLPPQATLLATSASCPVQMYRLGQHGYVTQFHPEMDLAAITTRCEIYRHSGYFAADELDAVLARVAAVDVGASHQVLRNFVHRYRHP